MASIRQRRRKDGSLYFSVLWRERGRQTSISVNEAKDAEYLKAHLDLTGQLPAVLVKPKSVMTVAELVEAHIDGLSGVQEFTRSKYRRLAALHIVPVLGALPVPVVDRFVIARWIEGIDRAPKTVKDVHALLSAAFNTGMRLGEVSVNPAARIRLPAIQRGDVALLEREAFAVVIENIAPKWRPFFQLLAQTGMRWGEAAALTASDVDMKRATIRISKAVKRIDGAPNQIGPTKTPRSRRTLSIPQSLLVELAPRMGMRGRIFGDLIGPALRSDSSRDAWERGVRKAKRAAPDVVIGNPLMRDLRHAHASWLLEAGVSPKVVQDRLGHEKVATTMEIYARVSRDADSAAAALLDDLGSY